ncbi:MAG: glucan biosynthesis protein G [Halomonadaceae bacterium]|nr:MAG: glucan biosynthesis protein G [Halomonadaceae bacterium]
MLLRRCPPGFCLLAVVLVACVPPGQQLAAQPEYASEAQPFSHQWLQEHARELATQSYTPHTMAEDDPLGDLSYDEYRRIAFDPEAAIWRDEAQPFQLQLFHPGFLHTTPVDIHLVNEGEARRLAFTTDLFHYRHSPVGIDQFDARGYAGFRVHHPLNTPDYYDEFLVFLGASYFRAVGKHQLYGLSARGLAVNTVGPGDEEFPRFSQFWIETPDEHADGILIHALLDSPSVTGAYQFTVVPGEHTRIDVEASLYPRRDIAHLGIAPLTSMFFFDPSNRAGFDDYRNAVHDSHGLKILQANGELIWRPLANPAQVQVSAFSADSTAPEGFGLLQRQQDFARFNDAEARYHKRPSLWIEPQGDWGKGQVELLEIPTADEYHDNIVTYWQPTGGLAAGSEYHFQYRMHWGGESPLAPQPGRVIETAAGTALSSDDKLFVIDYSDGRQIPDQDEVLIQAATSAGEITAVSGTLVEDTGHYRAYVRLDPGEDHLAELRVTLEVDGEPWGETWLYRWTQ